MGNVWILFWVSVFYHNHAAMILAGRVEINLKSEFGAAMIQSRVDDDVDIAVLKM